MSIMAPEKPMNLDEALDYVQTQTFDANTTSLNMSDMEGYGWFVVSTGNEGEIAYFAREDDALAFRLLLVNLICNPGLPKRGQ